MIGHLPILQIRRQGMKPAAVFVRDFPCKPTTLSDIEGGELPSVSVEGDDPSLVDMRWAVGMTVHLWAKSNPSAWVDRLLTDGARHIIDFRGEGEIYEWRQ